jgi:hypothetical protein
MENPGLGETTANKTSRASNSIEKKGKGLLSQRKKLTVKELPPLPTEDKDLEDAGERLQEGGKTFSQMLEESAKGPRFQEGEVVEGTIVKTSKD